MMSEDLGKSGRRSCFLVCVSLLVLFGTVLGFIAGLLVGGLLAKHGQFASQGRIYFIFIYFLFFKLQFHSDIDWES